MTAPNSSSEMSRSSAESGDLALQRPTREDKPKRPPVSLFNNAKNGLDVSTSRESVSKFAHHRLSSNSNTMFSPSFATSTAASNQASRLLTLRPLSVSILLPPSRLPFSKRRPRPAGTLKSSSKRSPGLSSVYKSGFSLLFYSQSTAFLSGSLMPSSSCTTCSSSCSAQTPRFNCS